MKLALIQLAPVWNAEAANIAKAQALCEARADADLLVLPEMWATGFDPAGVRPTPNAPAWMRAFAKEHGSCVAGSLAVREGERWKNRFYFIGPDGEVAAAYDKRHVFPYGAERDYFSAGRERCLVRCGGMRILLQTCFDLRFPAFGRNAVLAESERPFADARGAVFDVAVYVGCWPQSRIDAWDCLLPARAVENQSYTVGVNHAGTENGVEYGGHSAAYDFSGRALLALGSEEATAAATLDSDALEHFRKKFPFLQERDAFDFHF